MTTRRSTLKTIAVVSAAIASQGKPALAQNPNRVKVIELAKLAKEGASASFEFDKSKAMVVRIAKPAKSNDRVLEVDAKTYLTAFNSACTHLGCQVNAPDNGQLVCDCHGSAFNLDGSVAQGPAKRPLQGIRLEVEAGVVYAVALIPIPSA